jgi:ABC-type sugar transport system substrate-binding protein
MPRRVIAWAVLLVTLWCAPPARARPLRVAFLDPREESTSAFWRRFVEIAEAAAASLGIELRVLKIGQWPAALPERTHALVSGPERPDYLVFSPHRGVGASVMLVAEEAKLPFFTVDSRLSDDEKLRYGRPRERLRYWIGEMLPDNESAAQAELLTLVEQARAAGILSAKGRIPLLALGGNRFDSAEVDREQGLSHALDKLSEVQLLQRVQTNWQREASKRKTELLLSRYPGIRLIWTAGDSIALGALSAVQERARTLGHDLLVGGIDWTPEAFRALLDGDLAVSVGGHFLAGAWVLVLLYDHHAGLDFAEERLEWRCEMRPAQRSDAARYRELVIGSFENMDFRYFSKQLNPRLSRYDFSMETILAALRRHRR